MVNPQRPDIHRHSPSDLPRGDTFHFLIVQGRVSVLRFVNRPFTVCRSGRESAFDFLQGWEKPLVLAVYCQPYIGRRRCVYFHPAKQPVRQVILHRGRIAEVVLEAQFIPDVERLAIHELAEIYLVVKCVFTGAAVK